MNLYQKYRGDIVSLTLILAVVLLARILFISFMPHTFSKDLYAWLGVIDVLVQGGNPYSNSDVLNWPLFWMQVLYGIHIISKYASVSAILLIQMVLIAGEAMIILVSYLIAKRFLHQQKPAKVLIIGLALNPISIFLNCQHCNFDVFVGLWVLLFTYALLDFYETKSAASWLMACFFLGMGIYTKTVPIILSPLLIIGTQNQKVKINLFGLILLFTPFVIGLSILISLGHEGIKNHFLTYRSMAGWYGISGILGLLKAYSVISLYKSISPFAIAGLLIFLCWRCYKITILTPKQLITVVLLIMFSLPTFGPGYSPPYTSWFLPLFVILFFISNRGMKQFLVLGYVIIATTYFIEYAFFGSHGAFMAKFVPTQNMLSLSDLLGSQRVQVLIRLPMFAFYIILFVWLVRDLNKEKAKMPL